MQYKNQYKDFEDEKPVQEISVWARVWTLSDYDTYNHELVKIHEEYQKCVELAKDHKGKPKMFASDFYQIRNGGLTEDMRVKYNKGLSVQVWNVNNHKLKKYFKWLDFSMTPEEKIEAGETSRKRFAELRQSIEQLSTSR